jgi:hypothetical protein
MYEIITLELIYSSHAWRLVSPTHRGAATLGLVLAVLLCTTQDLFVSSSSLRSVCSTAGTPPPARFGKILVRTHRLTQTLAFTR